MRSHTWQQIVDPSVITTEMIDTYEGSEVRSTASPGPLEVTVDPPTDLTPGLREFLTNVPSSTSEIAFTAGSVEATLPPGSGIGIVWDGADWIPG